MTTASTMPAHDNGTRVLVVAAAAALVVSGVGTALGAAVTGSSAAAGFAVGSLMTVFVLCFGSFFVNAVAGIMPGASMALAMLTYFCQILLLGMAFIAISGSGLLDETLHRSWLGAGVIAVTLVWMVAQVIAATRVRIPIYRLAEASQR